ncbi:MAG: hypothetical protein K0S56_402 [Microvirga sp.]|jgi:hypothetical protein|nr:hypothetical protein [Microvirga sp.]
MFEARPARGGNANRSSQPEVRNPVLALPAAQRIAELSPEARALLGDLLGELAADARSRAQRSWLQNKGPMALYWKALSVYAAHLRRALRNINTMPAGDGR